MDSQRLLSTVESYLQSPDTPILPWHQHCPYMVGSHRYGIAQVQRHQEMCDNNDFRELYNFSLAQGDSVWKRDVKARLNWSVVHTAFFSAICRKSKSAKITSLPNQWSLKSMHFLHNSMSVSILIYHADIHPTGHKFDWCPVRNEPRFLVIWYLVYLCGAICDLWTLLFNSFMKQWEKLLTKVWIFKCHGV